MHCLLIKREIKILNLPETERSLSGLLNGLSLGVDETLLIMGNRVPARAVSTSVVMNTGMKSLKRDERIRVGKTQANFFCSFSAY